jgi:hypothetical protein
MVVPPTIVELEPVAPFPLLPVPPAPPAPTVTVMLEPIVTA